MNGYDVDVAVVGGGPVGMWLAAELCRGGVRAVVLERRAARPPYSKALTIYPRTLEQFAMRGIADRWLAEGTVPQRRAIVTTGSVGARERSSGTWLPAVVL
jgi:2-polyprenyl-6-methoxyphenol hydroxylase-like FAD-dependent oxidoreductase